MTPDALLAAFALPASVRVQRRVPKTLLLTHGAPTAVDKQRLQAGVEDLHWLAALKPTTCGVPVYRDATREYVEIAVLAATLRAGGKATRLLTLIHRAIPYPVVLLARHGDTLTLSLAHKRQAQRERAAVVLDGAVLSELVDDTRAVDCACLAALPLARQKQPHLYALYQSWCDALTALTAARLTGIYSAISTVGAATARSAALTAHATLTCDLTRLLAAARRETQVSKQVELNLAVQQLRAQLTQLSASL